MGGSINFFEADLHSLFAKINFEVIVLVAVVAASVVILCIFVVKNLFGSRSRRAGLLPAIAPRDCDPGSGDGEPGLSLDRSAEAPAFIKHLAAAARAKGVPAPALETIMARLIDAELPDAEIPARLLAAADQLETLRSSLTNWSGLAPDHERICSEALACADRGDLDAAGEVLRHGREACWTLPLEASRLEAEFYAREAMIDHVQLRFRGAAQKYACAADLVMEHAGVEAWGYLIGQARELCDDGREFCRRESLLLAVEVCHSALGLVPREQFPREWAVTKHRLGDALSALGERSQDPEQLQEAVNAYLAVLEEWTREGAPADWAQAQKDLGKALQMLGEQEGDRERLRQAALAYHAALTEWTGESALPERARIQKRLGDVLAVLGIEEGDAERLAEAASAYCEAIEGLSREITPLDWAMIQNNLGNVLLALEEMEAAPGRLHQAVAAYQAALDERVLSPSSFAVASNNLGNALVAMGEREDCSAVLERAASAYRAALAAQPADAAPLAAAKTHMNLAYTLGALWNRTRNRQMLDEALASVEAALGLTEEAAVAEHVPAALAREAILAAMGRFAAGVSTV
jgi:tetratricopeptide (TPR) repeat protein